MEKYIEALMAFADITDETKARFAVEQTVEYIKNYCHIDEIPDELDHTVVLMAADMYKSEYTSSATAGGDGITSIREGDITVTYGSTTATRTNTVFKDYKARLNRFRKLVW